MDEFKKAAQDWAKYVDEQSDKIVKLLDESTKNLSGTVKKERKKLELRSQIGEHTRALNKAYTRLGEAYYNSVSEGKKMEEMQDVMDLVYSNRKVVELLNKELKMLEEEQA